MIGTYPANKEGRPAQEHGQAAAPSAGDATRQQHHHHCCQEERGGEECQRLVVKSAICGWGGIASGAFQIGPTNGGCGERVLVRGETLASPAAYARQAASACQVPAAAPTPGSRAVACKQGC